MFAKIWFWGIGVDMLNYFLTKNFTLFEKNLINKLDLFLIDQKCNIKIY